MKLTAILVVAVLLLPGCAGLNPGPVRDFAQSFSQAEKSLNQTLGLSLDWSKETFVQTLGQTDRIKLSSLMIHDTAGEKWKIETRPDYWELQEAGQALVEINQTFKTYLENLDSLLNGRAADRKRFEAAAEQLNQDIRDMAEHWGKTAREQRVPAGEIAGGFSEGASQLFAGKRRQLVIKHMRRTQGAVDLYADVCRELVAQTRTDLKINYGEQTSYIQLRWNAKQLPGRVTLARMVLELNDQYVTAMASLAELDRFYESLPAAHQEITTAYQQSPTEMKALEAMAESVRHLIRLQDTLARMPLRREL